MSGTDRIAGASTAGRGNMQLGLIALLLALAALPAVAAQSSRPESLALDAPRGHAVHLDRLLQQATAAAERGNFPAAEEKYRLVEELARDSDTWQRWAAISGQVWAARMGGTSENAMVVTRRVRDERPDLAGLMAIWEGDSLWFAGELTAAADRYRSAARDHGTDIVDGVPIGFTALRLLRQVELDRGNLGAAASAEHELLAFAAAGPEPKTVIVAGASACEVTAASDGFQNSINYDSSNFGYRFMEYPDCCSGWHPGVDLNAPNDCSLTFKAIARGCVRDTMGSASDYGTVSVEHYYLPDRWVSAYLHGDHPPAVSVGQAVTKGMTLGGVGAVGTSSCHLHQEVREADHGALFDAHAYHNTPQTRVGDSYQDPLPFIAAHRSYGRVVWADEGAFSRSGSWTTVTGIGDHDDMMWAATTSSLTNRVTYSFTTTASGTHELWAFVPWTNNTTRRAPYKLVRSSTGSVVISGSVDQSTLRDAWVSIGSAYLSSNTTYRIEVATNTGETGKRVAVDDFLVIRRP